MLKVDIADILIWQGNPHLLEVDLQSHGNYEVVIAYSLSVCGLNNVLLRAKPSDTSPQPFCLGRYDLQQQQSMQSYSSYSARVQLVMTLLF